MRSPTSLLRPAVGRLLRLVPRRIRETVLRAGPLAPVRRWFLASNATHWDQWYESTDLDEIEFDGRERRKFAMTAAAMGDGPLGRVLDIGCGPGIVAAMVAPRCEEYVGLDLSPVAVAKFNERLASVPNARAIVGSIPDDLPVGPFDVIVASDVFYYLTLSELERSLSRIETLLAPGGSFVTIHSRGDIGLEWTADEMHREVRRLLDLPQETARGDSEHAVDRFRKPERQGVPVMAEKSRAGLKSKVGAFVLGGASAMYELLDIAVVLA